MPTLEFKGKQHIYAHHLTIPYRPLDPDPARSCNPTDTEDNLIIHGDNLHALKALLPRYGGRVKCIYIDPPYNTGIAAEFTRAEQLRQSLFGYAFSGNLCRRTRTMNPQELF